LKYVNGEKEAVSIYEKAWLYFIVTVRSSPDPIDRLEAVVPRGELETCPRCGGDGGVSNGCERCNGTGWIDLTH
jgi:hypothetical protein